MQNEDVNLKGIGLFLGILAVLLLAAYGAVTAMSRSWETEARQADQQTLLHRPSATAQPYFPEPREQPDPIVDLKKLRASEEHDLTNYGWIDRTNGIVRIPIDRAIELLTQQGAGK